MDAILLDMLTAQTHTNTIGSFYKILHSLCLYALLNTYGGKERQSNAYNYPKYNPASPNLVQFRCYNMSYKYDSKKKKKYKVISIKYWIKDVNRVNPISFPKS